ncbi:hypothetical protein [Roseibium sp. RKSG952]|uniref:hypothetical protein n=1 Tax=Roseibium sp. RKSG952 TaxID=2529384 RepID=UPI0012BBF0D4|nr:hypothetical protein [Roseibium sp. RKSG952]MTH96543.1 hypothetical protein [Roseibium sp. RKSG952]
MKEPFIFEWDGRALVPATPYDLERCQRFKKGQRLKADKIVKPRSLPMQGMYWACLSQFVAATECVPTAEHLHNLIKMKMGYVTPAVMPDGSLYWIPDSTAFDKMDQEAFNEFVSRADKWCAETFGASLLQAKEAA